MNRINQMLIRISLQSLLVTSLLILIIIGQVSYADTGKLFTALLSGNQLTVTPTSSASYPSMGIKLTSKHTVSGCDI